MNATATAPPPDFADWLSPMLVKELRQGMRTRVFIAVFLLMQLVMIFVVAFNLTSLASDPARFDIDTFNGWFWAMTAIPLLAVMPLRGLTALSSEMHGNTLELIHLTRLSAWRILAGKWFSLVAQSLLLVAAVLPYAVLRYFFGEVNVVADLRNLGVFIALSVVLTAAMVTLSTAPLWLRIVLLVLSTPFVFIGFFGFLISQFAMRASASLPIPEAWFLLAVACYVPVYTLLVLQIGATRIAPPAENHAAWKRLLALVLLVLPFASWGAANRDVTLFYAVLSLPGILFVLMDAINEPLVLLPPLARPFARRGLAGRLAGLLLHPGWPSAVLLTLFMSAIALFLVPRLQPGAETRAVLFVWVAAGALLLPVLVHQFLFRNFRHPFLLYTLIQIAFAIIWSFAAAISAAADDTITPLLVVSPLPLPGALILVFNRDAGSKGVEDAVMAGAGLVTLLVVLLLQFKLVPAVRRLLGQLRTPQP